MKLSILAVGALVASAVSAAHVAVIRKDTRNITPNAGVMAEMTAIIRCDNGVNKETYEGNKCTYLSGFVQGSGINGQGYGNGYKTTRNGSGMQIWKDGKYLNCMQYYNDISWRTTGISTIIVSAEYLCTDTTWR